MVETIEMGQFQQLNELNYTKKVKLATMVAELEQAAFESICRSLQMMTKEQVMQFCKINA